MSKNKTEKPVLKKNNPPKPNLKPTSSNSNKLNLDNTKLVSNPASYNKTNETNYSFKSSTTLNGMVNNEDNVMGESVRVALRIRPMNNMENTRGDQNCVKVVNDQSCQIMIKYKLINI